MSPNVSLCHDQKVAQVHQCEISRQSSPSLAIQRRFAFWYSLRWSGLISIPTTKTIHSQALVSPISPLGHMFAWNVIRPVSPRTVHGSSFPTDPKKDPARRFIHDPKSTSLSGHYTVIPCIVGRGEQAGRVVVFDRRCFDEQQLIEATAAARGSSRFFCGTDWQSVLRIWLATAR